MGGGGRRGRDEAGPPRTEAPAARGPGEDQAAEAEAAADNTAEVERGGRDASHLEEVLTITILPRSKWSL